MKLSEIKFVNVAFSYAEKRVLDKVDFVIQPGSFVGVVGPNGAGKSTLLKLAAGLLMPMQGAIAIGNKNCTKAAHAGMIGYVPQQISDNYVGFPANVREIIETGNIFVNTFSSFFYFIIEYKNFLCLIIHLWIL